MDAVSAAAPKPRSEYALAVAICVLIALLAHAWEWPSLMLLMPITLTVAALSNKDDGTATMFVMATNFATFSILDQQSKRDAGIMRAVASAFALTGIYRVFA